MNEPALKALLSRHSLGGKHLVEPGPSPDELARAYRGSLSLGDSALGGLLVAVELPRAES